MLAGLIIHLEVVIRGYGALGVFFAALLEEIVAPIPSSLVATFAGFFLVPHDYTWLQALPIAFFKVALPMGVGVTLGSLLFYALAYFGGKPLILRYGAWFGLSWELIEKTEEKFTKGSADEIILLTMRALPFVPSVAISVFCGLVRYPLKTFIVLSFIGTVIRSMIMALIGWQVRDAYVSYAGILSHLETFVSAGILVALVVFLVVRLRQRKKDTKNSY